MSTSRHRYLSVGLHTLQDRERRLRQLERLLDEVSQRRRELHGRGQQASIDQAAGEYQPHPSPRPE
jgi:hypothetical protein